MKKILSVIISLSMLLSLSVQPIRAAAEQTTKVFSEDEEIYFGHPELQDFALLQFDKNRDGKITRSEMYFDNENEYFNFSPLSSGGSRLSADQILYNLQFGENVKNVTFYIENMEMSSLNAVLHFARDQQIKLNVNMNYVYLYESGNVPEFAEGETTGEISLIIEGNFSGDFSMYGDYNITTLHIYNDNNNEEDFTWFAGKYLKDVEIKDNGGFNGDLSKLLSTSTQLEAAIIPSYAAKFIPSEAPLKLINLFDVENYERLTNEAFADFINKHSGLTSLSSSCLGVNDLSPLKNAAQLYEVTMSAGSISEDFAEGRPIGDVWLEQLVEIPQITSLTMNYINVTDLTPLLSYTGEGKTALIHCCWVDMRYKNNAEISSMLPEEVRVEGIFGAWTTGGIFTNHKGKTLLVSTKESKKYSKKGDNITFFITITNMSKNAVDIDLYNISDGYDIVYGDDVQSIKSLESGQSVTKSLTVKDNSEQWISNRILISVDGCIIAATGSSFVYKGNRVTLFEPGFITAGDTLNVSGSYSGDTKKLEIITSDGEVLKIIDNCEGKTGFNMSVDVPEKYLPTGSETSKTLTIKAVATDENGDKATSSNVEVQIFNNSRSEELNIEEAHYMTNGSGVMRTIGSSGIIFSGEKMLARVKFSGPETDKIVSAKAIVNNRTYNMTKYDYGKYDGYYRAVIDGITDADYYTIMLEVTTESGFTLKRLIGIGRVLIDPSGIISDPDGNPIDGVKVTLQRLNEKTNEWVDWDAENYLQSNPVYTTATGYYGWDVIEGTYRLIAEKEGYETTIIEEYFSREQGKNTAITVLPPRFDVDFTMNYADPENPPLKTMNTSAAKSQVESALQDLELPANTGSEAVINELSDGLSDNIYLSFKKNTYAKTGSTTDEQGSIRGTIIVENISTDETEEVEINIPLSLLSDTPQIIETIGEFADKLSIEETAAENGDTIFTVTTKDSAELPQLRLYMAVYTNGRLDNVTIGENSVQEGKLAITFKKPENKTYKVMLWTADKNVPVIEAITE